MWTSKIIIISSIGGGIHRNKNREAKIGFKE